MSDFLNLVKAERQKQINKHGYTHEHDDKHTDGAIADAAACFATEKNTTWCLQELYPWEPWFLNKTEKSRKEQIITACAMLMAEWERIDRIEKKATVNLCEDCNLCPATCGASPKFGTGLGNDNVYKCDTFKQKPYQMSCPYGLDGVEEPIICDRIFSPEEIEEFTESYGQCGEIKLLEDPELSFASNFDQKILDRTKILTAQKRDKSGEFMIGEERFIAEFEIAMTMPAFVSLFDNGFFTPEQFGFDSSVEMWRYYAVYFNHGGLVFVHKIISIGVDVAMGVEG